MEFENVIKKKQKTLSGMYSDLNDIIQAKFNKAIQKDSFLKKSERNNLYREIEEKIDAFEKRYLKSFKSGVNKIVDAEVKRIRTEVEESELTKKQIKAFQSEKAKTYYSSQKIYVQSQTEKMKSDVKKQIRNAGIRISSVANQRSISLSKAREAYSVQQKNIDFTFVDKANRKWDLGKYLNIFENTSYRNLSREVSDELLSEMSHDLVVVMPNDANDPCKNWIGKVLSLSGANKNYPSYDAAKQTNQIFHPNCRHYLVPYKES